jgi:hypothetical protein
MGPTGPASVEGSVRESCAIESLEQPQIKLYPRSKITTLTDSCLCAWSSEMLCQSRT